MLPTGAYASNSEPLRNIPDLNQNNIPINAVIHSLYLCIVSSDLTICVQIPVHRLTFNYLEIELDLHISRLYIQGFNKM